MFMLLAFDYNQKWNKIIKWKKSCKAKFSWWRSQPLSKYNLNSGPIFSFSFGHSTQVKNLTYYTPCSPWINVAYIKNCFRLCIKWNLSAWNKTEFLSSMTLLKCWSEMVSKQEVTYKINKTISQSYYWLCNFLLMLPPFSNHRKMLSDHLSYFWIDLVTYRLKDFFGEFHCQMNRNVKCATEIGRHPLKLNLLVLLYFNIP